MLVTDRQAVLDLYAEARERRWVLPCFCSENLTTSEAVLAALLDHGRSMGEPDLPITLAITNRYPPRPQSCFYTHTRDWELGLRLFLADLRTLTSPPSPFAELRVMVHLDHIQPEIDAGLLKWDMAGFSSIMFDASKHPLESNLRQTRAFVERHGRQIVIEGACDEIVDAGGEERGRLTTADDAERYVSATGVDLVVANLGTEHRASDAGLRYHGDLARQISSRIGPRIVLHGCSSVPASQVADLYNDGVCKVNIWTALERDSSPRLLETLTKHAAKSVGPANALALQREGLLGPRCDVSSHLELAHCTTAGRQQIVFEAMKEIVSGYLRLWYRDDAGTGS